MNEYLDYFLLKLCGLPVEEPPRKLLEGIVYRALHGYTLN